MIEKVDYTHLEETLYHFVLANGLNVFLIPKNQFQETYASITTFFGSIHNQVKLHDKTVIYPYGIAHFLEHKLFEKEDEKDMMLSFINQGAESNAYTSHKKTTYLFSTTSNVIENLELLQKLAFIPYFTESSLKKEVDIIDQEISMYLDDPDYMLYQGILALLYPDTPLAVDIAGTTETISEITVEELYQNTEFFYRPDNMALVMAGNIDIKQIEQVLRESPYGHPISSSQRIEASNQMTKFPIKSSQSQQLDVVQPKLAVGFRPNFDLTDEAIETQKLALLIWLEMILGETSQLYQQWYEEGRFTLSLNYELEYEKEFQFLIISLETSEPIAMTNRIKKVILNFNEMSDFSETRLQQVKREWQGSYFRQLDQLENFVGQFILHLERDSQINYLDYPEMIDNLTLDGIYQVVQKFCQGLDVTDFTIFPKNRKKN